MMPLAIVQMGRRVRIVTVDADADLGGHLAALGLVPGSEVDVLGNGGPDSFVIAVKGTRIMLGRGMAGRILVT
jgi:Fe2+ transport system protein FeoA